LTSGFTAFAEQASAPEVVAELNTFYELVVPVLAEHGAHANKFVGDGLLAVFGAPDPLLDADRGAPRPRAKAVRSKGASRSGSASTRRRRRRHDRRHGHVGSRSSATSSTPPRALRR
jgi:class 3 adenylate cyclase